MGFSIYQNLELFDPSVVDDNARRDGFIFSDLLQNPDRSLVFFPETNSNPRITVARYFFDTASQVAI